MPSARWPTIACLVGAAELIVPWKLLGSDAYMALVAGRLVAQHGLPHADSLAIVTAGTPWVDQQWLAQLALYGASRVGGLFALVVLHALLVGGTAAIASSFAEKRGASFNALLVGALAVILVDSEYVILRAQSFAMVLFAATLVLTRSEKRAHLVWPLLALWANVHGSVVVGCALVALRGAFDLAKKKIDGAIFVAGAIAAPFVTPYAREMPAYFARYASHVGATHELPVIEWLPPGDATAYVMVAVVVALVVVPWARTRERPDVFEAVVLVACGVAGLRAARNMIWFGIAVAAYGPALVDRIERVRVLELPIVARFVSLAPIALLAGVVRLALLPASSLERMYPTDALAPLRAVMKDHPEARLVASDIYADWILFRVPETEGRIEIDARLELLTREEARDLGRFLFAADTSIYPDARLALVSKKAHRALADKLRTGNIVWESEDALLVWR